MRTCLSLKALLVICLTLAFVSIADAQATRTWVSGVGDDANPCSRTAPCKTFAGAISKTLSGGEIDALDPGGFGAVTITKGITLDGNGTLASILVNGTNGITVNAPATDTVIIRNLSINGAPGTGLNGINYIAGGHLIVENVEIERFTNSLINANLTAAGNLTINSLRGANSAGSVANVDAGIRATTSGGILKVMITNTTLQNNQIGINLQDNVQAIIRDTAIRPNASASAIGVRVATAAAAATTSAHLEGVSISFANEGLRTTTAGGAVKVFLSSSSIFNCTTGSNAGGGSVTVTSFINNRFANNGLDTSGSFVTKAQQ